MTLGVVSSHNNNRKGLKSVCALFLGFVSAMGETSPEAGEGSSRLSCLLVCCGGLVLFIALALGLFFWGRVAVLGGLIVLLAYTLFLYLAVTGHHPCIVVLPDSDSNCFVPATSYG